MVCTVLENNYNTEGIERKLDVVINYIRSEKLKDRIESIREGGDVDKKKMLLPAFLPAGIFRGGKTKEHLYKFSGIVHIDIDGKIKAGKVLSQIDITHVCFMFRSPRKGLKIGFRVNASPEDYSWAWKYLNQKYCLGYGDISSKALNKQSSLSYDPEAYFNGNCEVCNIPEAPKYKNVNYPKVKVRSYSEAFKVAEGALKRNGHYFRKGSRNDYIYRLCCILNRMGIDKVTASQLLGNRFGGTKFPMSEINLTLNGVYKRNAQEHGSRPIC